jgi:hypothetical protein
MASISVCYGSSSIVGQKKNKMLIHDFVWVLKNLPYLRIGTLDTYGLSRGTAYELYALGLIELVVQDSGWAKTTIATTCC